jgi:hypothetical protein
MVAKFLGATIVDMSAVGGNNPSASELQLRLVEDTVNGDSFTTGVIGAPYTVSVGSFTYQGLLRNYARNKSIEGNPTWDVQLTSPYELLEGTEVILDSYAGTTSGVANLMNVFGYWESANGFGGSLINDSGMVWESPYQILNLGPSGEISYTTSGTYGIKPGIYAIQNGSAPNFGASIKYRNNDYRIDLSQLSGVPSYYRFGLVGSTSLADIINQIARDAGCDYFLTLHASGAGTPHTIKVNKIDYSTAPPLGSIEAYVTGQPNIISSQIGAEMRNEDTSLFLTGDNIQFLMQQSDSSQILPFWGFDGAGLPFIGAGVGDSYTVTVDATSISDIIGTTSYTLDIGEMRTSLIEQDIWAGYLSSKNPSLATTIGIGTAFSVNDVAGFNPVFPQDFVGQNRNQALAFESANSSDTWTNNIRRVYEFVRGYAENYYGRRFMVRTPISISLKQEPETLRYVNSYEPIESAFTEAGTLPLGLNAANEIYFTDPEGKFKPVVKFTAPTSPDYSSLTDAQGLVQGSDVYVEAQYLQDYGVFYHNGASYIALELALPNGFYEIAPDALGGISDINTLFGADLTTAATYNNASLAGRLHPRAFQPSAATIPMKSNFLTYGGWAYVGAASGKTRYEQRTDLNPWNYGGFSVMNAVASSYIQGFASQAQVVEYGSVKFVGTPDKSLGDALSANGAIITNVDLQRSNNGYVTQYQFKSFTPRRATGGQEQFKRFIRLGRQTAQVSRYIRETFRANQLKSDFLQAAKYRFLENTSRAIRNQTPHGVLYGAAAPFVSGKVIPLVGTMTFEESVAASRPSSEEIFKSTSIMSLDGLVRPFCTTTGTYTQLPHYEAPTSGFSAGAITNTQLNPWQRGNDLEWVSFSASYSGLSTRKNPTYDVNMMRPLALRGPLSLEGWGYDLFTTKPTPNSGGSSPLLQNMTDAFTSGYLQNSLTWKVGSVDLMWDKFRKVWASPGCLLFGRLEGSVSAGSTQTARVHLDRTISLADRMTVRNLHNVTLTSGLFIQFGFNPLRGEYSIVSADC